MARIADSDVAAGY